MKVILGACLAFGVVIASSMSASAARCGPFGDPPAEVSHGWFASFLTRHSPVCSGAKLLGPWKDAGGDERYACLYEPSGATRETPLPLVVFLHGLGADGGQFEQFLNASPHRAIAVTLVGFGKHEKRRPTLGLDDHSRVLRMLLREIVTECRPRRTVLVGHSAGAD